MPIPSIYLVDRNPEMIAAWCNAFEGYSDVNVVHGDYFAVPTDAIVSPANSFGIMDGGLDTEIAAHVGHKTVHNLQVLVMDRYFGELPVGEAIMLDTENGVYKSLISAPTMRIPENVSQTLNAYLAFRAVLRVVKFSWIDSVTVPAFCHGIGGMRPERIALQMKMAYDMMSKPTRIPSYDFIHKMHRAMQIA